MKTAGGSNTARHGEPTVENSAAPLALPVHIDKIPHKLRQERKFDFSLERFAAALPAPGEYAAVVTEVKVIPKPDVTWMVITFAFTDAHGRPQTAVHLVAVDCAAGSAYARHTAKGQRTIGVLLYAIGSAERAVDRLDDLTALLQGAKLNVVIAVGTQDGLPTINIRAFKKLGGVRGV